MFSSGGGACLPSGRMRGGGRRTVLGGAIRHSNLANRKKDLMFRYRAYFQRGAFALLLVLISGQITVRAQEVNREEPTWWFGAAGAGNFNFYRGTAQVLNSTLTAPAPFHKGSGVGLYAGLLAEYRPGPVWGAMLNVGYDDRRGAFDTVMSACGCPGYLSTSLSYLSIAPSLRVAPFSSGFYLFAGPRIGFNLSKSFTSKQEGKPGYIVEGEFSDMRSTVISGEVGAGIDIALNSPNAATRISFSPFVAFQPYFGQDPRSVETWNVTTLRVGAALKFGSGKIIPAPPAPRAPTPVVERDVTFAVRAPLSVPAERRVKETFPLRNHVFFDRGSREIPGRYVLLSPSQAAEFKEEQLQAVQPDGLDGRSTRQLAVYYNILNILGDRMRSNSGSAVTLVGSSGQGATDGKDLAESVKRYLVSAFGIDRARIVTQGRVNPRSPSVRPGLSQDMALRRAEDRRVDIETTSPVLLQQVGGPTDMLRPVQIVGGQEDPLDSHAVFTVAGARASLSSWSLEVTGAQAGVQRFGPYTGDRATIPGETILGNRTEGDYNVVMTGQTKSGRAVRKEGTLHLVRPDVPDPEMLRFSVLFDFDRSKTPAMFESFLTSTVAPLIPDGGAVIIRGHTDAVGDDTYNQALSRDRAMEAERILKSALARAGTRGVTFETRGFGEDVRYAPFDNRRPEGRFYNRTVIIDVVPRK